MDYIGLTEEELLDVIIGTEGEIEREKGHFDSKLRDLGIRDEEIKKRMMQFEATYLIRKLIAENNRRLAEDLGEEFDISKKDLFI